MSVIHFIERTDNVRKTDPKKNEWESGFWPIPEETAQKLVGGSIYLHKGKQQPSHFGGKILSYRIEQTGPAAGSVVFTLRASVDGKGVKTDGKGWTKDTKIFWDAPVSADV